MKNLVFFLVVALNGTLSAQNIDKDSLDISDTSSLYTEFLDGVMLELSKWNLTFKEGDNDSLTFALLPTLFTNPATKYEFEKINPRITTEVFVTISNSTGDLTQISFPDWIQQNIRVLDTTKWKINIRSYNFTNNVGEVLSFIITLENNETGQYRQINFVYTDQSSDGSTTNLFSITDDWIID
jgi:hypothetical protein